MLFRSYRILLCFNGPAVYITGALDGGIPVTAYLQYQDWGTPLTYYLDAEESVLLQYARSFYFGE